LIYLEKTVLGFAKGPGIHSRVSGLATLTKVISTTRSVTNAIAFFIKVTV